jgi:hemoglobin
MAERDAWLGHMRAAMDELALPREHDATLWRYLTMAATSMVNADTSGLPSGSGERHGP